MRLIIYGFLLWTISIIEVGGVSIEKDLMLTYNQKMTLDKFREQVKPLLKNEFMKTDIYLIRWLRARAFDINEAEKMLKDNLTWREKSQMDTIKFENQSYFFKEFPSTVDTYDKEGRPIGVIDMYDWDIRGAVMAGEGQKLLRYMDYLLENVTMQVYERMQMGMNVTQFTVLANAENFNLITQGCPVCLPLWIQVLSSLENHYRGWLNEFIVIEAPTAAYTMFDMLRPLLSVDTRNAIKIFSMNKNQWMKYLDDRIQRDQRRPLYGGTKPPVKLN